MLNVRGACCALCDWSCQLRSSGSMMRNSKMTFIPLSLIIFRNNEWRHKWLKKKSVSLVEINISIVEKPFV